VSDISIQRHRQLHVSADSEYAYCCETNTQQSDMNSDQAIVCREAETTYDSSPNDVRTTNHVNNGDPRG